MTTWTRERAVAELAKALQHAAHEHSRPNTFYVRELANQYTICPTHWLYRIGRECQDPQDPHFGELYAALGGRERWGSAPTYSRGRFHV